MKRDQAVELLRAADPASEKTSEVDRFPSMTALLDRIDERSTDVQTQERPRTEQQEAGDRRPRWLIPALAGAAAIILAIVVGTLVLAGGSDEPDVIEPTPTTTPTTVPEAVVPTPIEVMDLHSQAVAVGDWAALRALYADLAEFEVNSETGETFVERIALTDLEAQTPYDWDGDGLINGFDALIDDAARVAAHGATAFVSCSQVDDVTAACDEVWEGHVFMTPGTRHNSWTVTIVDGLITTQVLEVVERPNPIDTDLTSQYNAWVSDNRPELRAAQFEDIITLAVSPDTVPVHRELIAEWQADLAGRDAAGPEARPATPVSATLDEAYYARASGDFDAAVMGIEPGTITAEWYRADGFYVVFFEGLDTTTADSLCPGAWVDGAGPDFMSYAPIGDEGCTFQGPSVRRVSEGARPLQCDSSLAYRTFIPEGTEGTLFATIDRTIGEGIMGITSMVDSSVGAVPEVDLSIFEC